MANNPKAQEKPPKNVDKTDKSKPPFRQLPGRYTFVLDIRNESYESS